MPIPKDIFELALREADKTPREGRREDSPLRYSQFTFKKPASDTADTPEQPLIRKRLRQKLPKIPRSVLGHAGSEKALRQRILQLQARLTRSGPAGQKALIRKEIARLKRVLRGQRPDLPLTMGTMPKKLGAVSKEIGTHSKEKHKAAS